MDEIKSEDITIATDRSVATIKFQRAKALNALTRAMRAAMMESFPKFARDPMVYAVVQRSASPRAFSAGSDVRELIALAQQEMGEARSAFREEYALDWQIECFSKPTVSLIDGMVMGGGVGISQFGTHKVAGDGYRWAMPETMIGLFPDVGQAHVLARMEGSMGMYLGLTGRAIGRADAYALGLCTHCIAATEFDAIQEGLAEVWPVDPLLDERHADPGEPELAPFREAIARCFSAASVEEIVDRLSGETRDAGAWAAGVVKDLAQRSPLSLKVTHRHIRNAAAYDIRETLQADYRLACRFLDRHDFREGVRANLIDKDGPPKWRPARLEDVTQAMVDDYFAPIGADEFVLPTRQEMQAARA
jgi:enoyl-CoA hydratase